MSDIGGGISDLFAAAGQAAEAEAYGKAAGYARQNAAITKSSTQIQELQANRTIYQSLGTEKADVAGAGFANTGSSLDLLKSSAQQGSLTKQLIANQGLITENSEEAQASAYDAQAVGAGIGAAGDLVGGLAKIFI